MRWSCTVSERHVLNPDLPFLQLWVQLVSWGPLLCLHGWVYCPGPGWEALLLAYQLRMGLELGVGGQTSAVLAVPSAVLAVGEQRAEKDAHTFLAMLSSLLSLPAQPQSPVQY